MLEQEERKELDKIIRVAERKVPKSPGALLNGLTNKEELYCQAMCRHGDSLRAIQDAGYVVKSKSGAASIISKLMDKGKILERIGALRETASIRSNVTVDIVVDMIVRTYHSAFNAGQFQNALVATKQLGDYLALFQQKPTTQITNVLNLTDHAVLDREIARLARAADVPLMLEAKDADYEVSDQGDAGPAGGGVHSEESASGDIREERADVEPGDGVPVAGVP